MKKMILLLAIIVLAVYYNTLGHSFVWDDHFTVEESDLITNVKYIPKIFVTDLYHSHAEKNLVEHSNYYRPLQALTFLIDYHIWKLNPFGFHLTNVLLHLANGILVFIAVFSICKSRITSIFTSILFLVHPVQTGAVNYITGRSDILACFFLLIAFIFYIVDSSFAPSQRLANIGEQPDSLINRITARKDLFYPISVLAFTLALLSKEAAIIFPLIVIFYDMTYGKRVKLHHPDKPLSLLKRYSAYLIVDAIYIALRLSIFNFTPEKKIFQNVSNVYAQFLTMCRTLMDYIGLLIYPAGLHMERETPLAKSAFESHAALSLAGLALLLFLAFVSHKRSRTIFFGMGWFIIFLIPFSNIIPISAMMAEHWLYIPSIGFFLVMSILFLKLQSLKINFNLTLALFILLTSLYSYRTVVRNRDWKDDLSIYTATLKTSSKKTKMFYNIGTVYESKGDLEKAVRFYKLAIDDGMEEAALYTNLGIVYMRLEDYKKAEENLKKALELNPNQPFAHNGLGGLFEKMGLIEEAISEYKKAIECHPNFYDAHVNLAVIYDSQGRFSDAIHHFEKAFSIKRDRSSYYNLGEVYHRAGDVNKAMEVWKEGGIEK